ncbi:glycoside hydrolase family 36 protein [Enterococcus olivae]
MSKLTNLTLINSSNVEIQQTKQAEQTIYDLTVIDDREPLAVTFSFPLIEISRFWTPVSGGEDHLPNLWSTPLETQINYSMPLFSFLNEAGQNKWVVALSEAKYKVETLVGVHEETACLHLTFRIPQLFDLRQLYIYTDEETKEFYQGITEARQWMYQINDLEPLARNEKAYQPVYSTWYSFHQSLNQVAIEKQKEYFKENHLKTIILDDGWQTDDSNRRYAYAGDWEIARKKFPDMKNHIQKFQKEGINYLVWITLPYIGKNTAAFHRFEQKFLYYDEYQQAGILDPRYPEVREYLIEKLMHLIEELNLDGLKIDFVDAFKESQPIRNEAMDGLSLENAIEELLQELTKRCIAYKADFLFEYREDYFGPWMNQLANIIRVKDCPNDLNRNRYSIANLRLLCPTAAIHSDMILFHSEETMAYTAFQLLHCLFGVIQLSVDLTQLSSQQRKLLRFWMNYQQENFSTLFEKAFQPLNPHARYNLIIAGDETKKITAKYQSDIVLPLDRMRADEVDIINATLDDSLVLSDEKQEAVTYELTIFDVFGEFVDSRKTIIDRISTIEVPSGGFIRIKKWQGGYDGKNKL